MRVRGQVRVSRSQKGRGYVQPVQPGWVVVPNSQAFTNEWYHLVGWEGLQPVIAMDTGVTLWRTQFGEDGFCIATLEEWNG